MAKSSETPQILAGKRVLVTGATGLIGQKLCLALLEGGAELVITGRSPEAQFRKNFSLPCTYGQWADPESPPPGHCVQHSDIIVHLAGESLANGRWNEKRKQDFYASRINSTRSLVRAANAAKVKTFLCASAIGVFGDCADVELTEDSRPGKDFLAKLCTDWESAARDFTGHAAQLRFGLVLSEAGGALTSMQKVFELGAGGPLGSGKQWMSWIHIDDVIHGILFVLKNKIAGAINFTAPKPERNADFSRELAKALQTRSWLPAPKIGLRIALGEMANVVLASQKVIPRKLLESGYTFKFAQLNLALQDLFAWKTSPRDHLFTQVQWVPGSIDDIFAFFSDEKNLELLTPEFLSFKVLGKSTAQMQNGTEIRYSLKIHKVPTKWISLIRDWNPPTEFSDEQLKGPYARWSHRHLFRAVAGGVLLEDKVVYRLPLASLGGELGHFLVKRDIQTIFAYRKAKISHVVKPQRPSKPDEQLSPLLPHNLP